MPFKEIVADGPTDQNELRQIDRALGKAKAALVCDGRSGDAT